MDIKQLVTGDPKTGFYPITQDTITVIELNKAVMSLTNESSSEDIIAAFDNLESFQALIAEVRNPQNICSGILINETPEDKRVGKYEASIIANIDAETLHVRWIEIDKIVALTITNTDGTMSCVRNESVFTSGGSVDLSNYLAKNNTDEYTPTEDYNPSTKKYVDDKSSVSITRVYNGRISLQHTEGKNLVNDICESFDDFIAIFDNLKQLNSVKFTNPFTGMSLPTNVNEFLEAFQNFASTYNVYDGGIQLIPIVGEHASDENIIIVGFYRTGIGPAEITLDDASYVNWIAGSVFGFGINTTNGSYVQLNNYQSRSISLNAQLVTHILEKVNNLNLTNYATKDNVLTKNNTTPFTPDADYEPATKKYVDESQIYTKLGEYSCNVNNINFTVYNYSSSKNGHFENISTNECKFDRYAIYDGAYLVTTIVNLTIQSIPQPGSYNTYIFKYKGDLYEIDLATIEGTSVSIKLLQRILTESEYAALGEVVNTDGILYFVTPDA